MTNEKRERKHFHALSDDKVHNIQFELTGNIRKRDVQYLRLVKERRGGKNTFPLTALFS